MRDQRIRMGMRKLHCITLVLALMGIVPRAAVGEDFFAPVKKVYLNDGRSIECQMAWLDGAKMICRKFGGNMTLPLQSVDFDKTYPNYRKTDRESVLLVHPGPRYQDENIVISNVRMSRPPESEARNSCVVAFEIMNRGNPCQVRAVLNALDAQDKALHQFEISSESTLDTGESSILESRLDGQGDALGNRVALLKVSHVERRNVLENPLTGKQPENQSSTPDRTQHKGRDEKIRLLKEAFLKERPTSP